MKNKPSIPIAIGIAPIVVVMPDEALASHLNGNPIAVGRDGFIYIAQISCFKKIIEMFKFLLYKLTSLIE